VQLALLPPCARDTAADTDLVDLLHGVYVRKKLVCSRGRYQCDRYILFGAPLKASQPVREGWFLRGELIELVLLNKQVKARQ
jgi:hypothetical protein